MRLIDADALRERFLERAKRAEDDGMPMTAAEMSLVARDIDRAPTVMDWISVRDRLPEPPCRCLVYTPYNEYGDGMITATFTEYGWMTPGYIGQVTHWMPLPEPPEGVSGDE